MNVRRFAFIGTICLSALVFAAAAALWIWSGSHADVWVWRTTRTQDMIVSARGDLGWSHEKVPSGIYSPLRRHLRMPDEFSGMSVRNHFAGFGWDSYVDTKVQYRVLIVPDWFLTAVSLPLPLIWLTMRWKRRRRGRPTAVCATCGYDLRATPEDQSRYPLNYASRIGTGRGH